MPTSSTTCKRDGCDLEVEAAGLCFAHKSAYLLEVIADAMRRKKILSATVGGLSAQLLPVSLLDDDAPTPPKGESKPVANEPEIPEHGSPDLREMMNGEPFDPDRAFAHTDG